MVRRSQQKTLLKRSSHRQRKNHRTKKKQTQSTKKLKLLEQKLLNKSKNKPGNKRFSKARKRQTIRLNRTDTKWTILLKTKRKTSRLSLSEIKKNSLAIKRAIKMRKMLKRRTSHRGTSLRPKQNSSREANRTKGKSLAWRSKILVNLTANKIAEKRKTPTNKTSKSWSTKSKTHTNSWLSTPRHKS